MEQYLYCMVRLCQLVSDFTDVFLFHYFQCFSLNQYLFWQNFAFDLPFTGECIPPRTISLAAATFNLILTIANLDMAIFQVFIDFVISFLH